MDPADFVTLKTANIESESFRAKVVAGSIDEENRTAEIVWSTGARVRRGYWDPHMEELSMKPKHIRMDRLKSGNAPLLNSHRSGDLNDQIGVITKASVKKGVGYATVRFSKEERVDSIWRDFSDGIFSNFSVGYRTLAIEETDEKENGLPVRRAIDWEPHEVSLVAIGADAGATAVRNSAPLHQCLLVRAAKENDMTPEQLEAQRLAAEAARSAQVPPAPAAVVPPVANLIAIEGRDLSPTNEEAVAADRVRSAAIRSAAVPLKVDAATVETAIARGDTADNFRSTHLATLEARTVNPIPDAGAHPRLSAGEDAKDKFARAVSNALIARSPMKSKVLEHARANGEKLDLDPGEFRGMTLLDLCKASLAQNGQRSSGYDKMGLAGAALSFRSGGGGHAGVSDFPVIMEDTARRMLLASYASTSDTWRKFCHIGSLSDFRSHKRLRLGSIGVLEEVNEHGEFRNGVIPDATQEEIGAKTKGKIVSLTRQAIVNDDLDAFSRLIGQLGRASARTIEKAVYALLALNGGLGPNMKDGLPLFDAAHKNIGAGTALSMDGIDADRVLMKLQTDRTGEEILDLEPWLLLVAAGLGGKARQVNQSEYDLGDVGGHAPNTSLGLYKQIVDTGRLSGTRRYSFADPSESPVIEVAFIDGVEEPYLEMRDGFRIDGVEWKIRSDHAVGAIDYVGATTDAGVAP